MAVSLKHTTEAVGTDAGNGEIRKAQWNEEHTLTMATARLLGRSTASAGPVEELGLSSGLAISSGNLVLGGPSFMADKNNVNQTGIADQVETKLTFTNEVFDTNGNYDNSRFTPTVAGYYLVAGRAFLSGTGLAQAASVIFKNGAVLAYGQYYTNQLGAAQTTVLEIVSLNGSSDYVELYSYADVSSGTITCDGTVGYAQFGAIFLRGL